MRVAQVNDIAHVATSLSRAMERLGHQVDVIAPRRVGAGLAYPWKLATLPVRAAGLVEAAWGIRRADYDVVHVHYARLGIVGPLVGQPYVLHCHGSDIRGVTPMSPWGFEVAEPLRRARLVYFATPDLARWVRPFRHDALFLPNPIELPPPMGVSPERDILVAVRLDPIKGVAAIVGLLRLVLARRPVTSVTIVDQGIGVEQVRAAAGADARVVPRVGHEDIGGLFARHRVAIGQLRVGALGNHELEAMAAGIPIVSSFQYPEAYEEPPPIVSGADPEEAAQQVVRLLDDEEARRTHGARARSWIATHHAADPVAGRVLQDYARYGVIRRRVEVRPA